MKKRLLTLITLLLLLPSLLQMSMFATRASENLSIVVSSTTAAPGSTAVVLTASIQDNPGVAAFELIVRYDSSKLTFKSGSNGLILPMFSGSEGSGSYNVIVYGTSNVTTNGTLFSLTFDVKSDASGFADVRIEDSSAIVGDRDENPVPFTLVPGGITVGTPTAPEITTASLPNGTVGTAYSQTLAASGSTPITWSKTSGDLPAGLTLSDAGVISGTPTATGTATFTVKVENAVGNDTKELSITVVPVPVAPTITTASLPGGTVGTAYNQILAADGDATITWTKTAGDLPAGLTLSDAGVISGTPTATGTANFTVKAENSTGDDTKALSITIAAAPFAPAIATASLPGGTVNVSYSQTLSATGTAPITWTKTGDLPAGLTLSSSGTISGTPTASGTFTFTVHASNGTPPDAAKEFTIVISKKSQTAPTITGDATVNKVYGDAHTFTATTAGDGTSVLLWSSSDPTVATIGSGTGVVTLLKPGTTNISVKRAGNGEYGDSPVSAAVVLTVTKKDVTISGLSVSEKPYDGTAAATITGTANIVGKVTGDDLTVSPGTASFNNKNVGTTKAVTFTGFSLSGTKAECYNLTDQPAAVAANITAKALTVNVTVNNRAYNGLTSATIASSSLSGVVSGDTVTLTNGTPTFAGVGPADNIAVSFTAFSISGADAGNYTLTQPTGIKANITSGFTPVKGTHYTTTALNAAGWTNTGFTVTAAAGYYVSQTNTDASSWTGSLSLTDDKSSGTITFYVRNISTKEISVAKTETFKKDSVLPTGVSITFAKINDGAFAKFFNFVSFGAFFKEGFKVTVTATDALSGIASISYKKTGDAGFTKVDAVSATFEVNSEFKGTVTAFAVDVAGNSTESSPVVSYGVVNESEAPEITVTNESAFSSVLTADTNMNVVVKDLKSGISSVKYKIGSDADFNVFTASEGEALTTVLPAFDIPVKKHGTYNVVITVIDNSGNQTIKTVGVHVEKVSPTITTTSLPEGTINKAYSQTLAATGSTPITWTIDSGTLPTGLTLSGNVISGTANAEGTFNFTVKATNAYDSDTKALSITIVHEHNWGSWTTKTDATCITKKEEERVCTITPAHVETRFVGDALGHLWNAGVVTTPATCSAAGVKTFTCTRGTCAENRVEAIAIDPAAHTWDGTWVTQTAATCSAPEIQVQHCTHNGAHTKTQSYGAADPANHQWGSWTTKTAATCTANEFQERVCNLNGAHKETKEIADSALGHSWDAGTVTTKPTCSAKGVKTFTCTRDGSHTKAEDIAIDPNAHNIGAWEVKTAATCTVSGMKVRKCTLCSIELSSEVIPAIGHSYGAWTTTLAATLLADGEEERVCAHNAGHKETRAIPKLSDTHTHSFTGAETITKPASCSEEGSKKINCSESGCEAFITESIPMLKHVAGEWEITVAATDNTSGTRVKKCTLCGEILSTDTIAPLANYDALKAAIAKGGAIAKGNYTDETWNVLQAALTAGKAIVAGAISTQEEIDAATEAILAAIAGLREKAAVPTPPVTELPKTGDGNSLPLTMAGIAAGLSVLLLASKGRKRRHGGYEK